jgi:hypothetical protein
MNPTTEKLCPTCGQATEHIIYMCEVECCSSPADYEGWWRVIDGFGIKTGLMQRRKVCQHHRYLLIGKGDQ